MYVCAIPSSSAVLTFIRRLLLLHKYDCSRLPLEVCPKHTLHMMSTTTTETAPLYGALPLQCGLNVFYLTGGFLFC